MAVLSLLEEESYGCDHLYAIALYNGMVLNPKIQLFLCVFFFFDIVIDQDLKSK